MYVVVASLKPSIEAYAMLTLCVWVFLSAGQFVSTIHNEKQHNDKGKEHVVLGIITMDKVVTSNKNVYVELG
jgi:hypothetical protein